MGPAGGTQQLAAVGILLTGSEGDCTAGCWGNIISTVVDTALCQLHIQQ